MRAWPFASAAVLVLAMAAAPAQAQYVYPYMGAYCPQPPRCAPSFCGSMFYSPNCCGCPVPTHCLRPPFAPHNGFLPLLQPWLQTSPAPKGYPNPPTRSPRDFFMYGQTTSEF